MAAQESGYIFIISRMDLLMIVTLLILPHANTYGFEDHLRADIHSAFALKLLLFCLFSGQLVEGTAAITF
jgi:hypothetical protein